MIITTEEFIQRYPQYNVEHVQNFQEHCQSIIQEYSLQSENLQIFSQVLFNNSFNFSQQFPVISLRMGLGKTTLLHQYIQYMRKHNKNYGAIVAVERIDTIRELCNRYDDYYGLYGFRQEECLEQLTYYNPNYCYRCNQLECRIKQNEEETLIHPIILITHARLNMLMQDKKALSDIMYFYNESRTSLIKRQDLFIDECPGFFTTDIVTENMCSSFQNALHHTYKKDCKSRRDIIEYFESHIHYLIQRIQGEDCEIDTSYLRLNDSKFIEFLKYKKMFVTNYYGAYYQQHLQVLNGIHQGGLIKKHILICPKEHNLQTGDYRSFILDGTAHIDPMYPLNTLTINIQDNREHTHINFHHDPSCNLSKTYYYKHPTIIPKLADQIKLKLSTHNKILLVTFKNIEDLFVQYFTNEERGRIYIDHFNNLKGKNHYNDATCLFYLGNLYKKDEFYLLAYKLLQSRKDVIFSIDSVEYRNVNNMHIPFIKGTNELHQELYELTNQLIFVDQYQTFYRIGRSGNNTQPIDYYYFNTDDNYSELIENNYPSANHLNEKLIRIYTEQDKLIDSLYEEFNNKEKGYKLNKKDFKEKYNIADKTFRQYIQSVNLVEYSILNNKFTLEKN